MTQQKLPSVPPLIEQKLTKAGYTRGATPSEIFQNRVTRNNTVLIDLALWDLCKAPEDGAGAYEKGSIALVPPRWYFSTANPNEVLHARGLTLGVNALLLFQKRADWTEFALGRTTLPDGTPFTVAERRTAPLGGVYFARVHGTVADGGEPFAVGFNSSAMRGAGIRVYEYASTATIASTRLQLEMLMWLCADAGAALTKAGMSEQEATFRRTAQEQLATSAGLLDLERLHQLRIINDAGRTVCPLCLNELSAADFMRRGEQVEGRETYDITITELSLFHIQELRPGKLQHKPYNLGWGHHFCNVVTKDAGIMGTLLWMQNVLDNQPEKGLEGFVAEARSVEEAVGG